MACVSATSSASEFTATAGDYVTISGTDATSGTYTYTVTGTTSTNNTIWIEATASEYLTCSPSNITWYFEPWEPIDDIDPEEERREIEDKLCGFLQKEMEKRLYFGENVEALNQLTKDVRLSKYWDEEKEEEVEEQFCSYLESEMKKKLYFGQRNEAEMLDGIIKGIRKANK